MNKVILADSQAIFRAGTAKVLAMDEDMRIIAQCTDLDRMMHAIATFPGSIVVLAASLRPDMVRLRSLLESTSSRGIVIAENNESASAFMQQGFRGVVQIRSIPGRYCMVSGPGGAMTLASDELPYTKCEQVGNPRRLLLARHEHLEGRCPFDAAACERHFEGFGNVEVITRYEGADNAGAHAFFFFLSECLAQ